MCSLNDGFLQGPLVIERWRCHRLVLDSLRTGQIIHRIRLCAISVIGYRYRKTGRRSGKCRSGLLSKELARCRLQGTNVFEAHFAASLRIADDPSSIGAFGRRARKRDCRVMTTARPTYRYRSGYLSGYLPRSPFLDNVRFASAHQATGAPPIARGAPQMPLPDRSIRTRATGRFGLGSDTWHAIGISASRCRRERTRQNKESPAWR